MSKKQEMIGKIFPTNNGGDCVVVDYINCKNITVRFLDGNNYQVKCQIKELNKGTIKNPYYPTVYGVGYLGEGVHIKTVKRKATKVYDIWKAMLARCYCNIFQQKQKTYLGCSVCDEWHNFQVFAEWYVNHEFYGLGYDLDKDILSKGNKIYSPDTCCLVPSEVNRVIVEKERNGRVLPTGIWKRGDSGAYTSKVMGEDGSVKSLGVFRSADSALIAYKAARENRVKQVAEKWKGKIKPDVYDALMNWTVE